MIDEYGKPIKYTSATHTVTFNRDGMFGPWRRYRTGVAAAAERAHDAVQQAHRQQKLLNQRKETHGQEENTQTHS